jgi:hypothetical protein
MKKQRDPTNLVLDGLCLAQCQAVSAGSLELLSINSTTLPTTNLNTILTLDAHERPQFAVMLQHTRELFQLNVVLRNLPRVKNI